MVDRKIFNQISRGIMAAEGVRSVYDSNLRSKPELPAVYDRVSVLNSALAAIAEQYQGAGGNRFSEALEKSSKYCTNYRNVKNHFRSIRSGNTDKNDIIKTLKVLSPIFGSRSGATIDKILLILELLDS